MRTADAVVVGGGTVGAWCAYFLRQACAGGAGMMWRPAVARAAADIALTGWSEVLDVSPLGLDRFDDAGRSRLATDPIALPFPEKISSS
ncbi:MAG TPA: hypothetical protein VED20_16140 [Streptosporangiaceae bacterium]|nr:hypothetical protein [Streptosporangiaceae bacterium]